MSSVEQTGPPPSQIDGVSGKRSVKCGHAPLPASTPYLGRYCCDVLEQTYTKLFRLKKTAGKTRQILFLISWTQ